MGGIGKIALRNACLNIITVGIYRFWGKTRLRRYLWDSIEIDGEPLEYTGLGRELFFGFLIVLAVLIPLGIAVNAVSFYLATQAPASQIAFIIAIYVLFALLFQYAVIRARRYRLTRTFWRGIRGGQSGSCLNYAFRALLWLILTVATLGLIYPVMRTKLQRWRTTHTWFGDRQLGFDGAARKLLGKWFIAWLLLLPSLGIIYFWYRAAEFRYFASVTRLEGLRFNATLRGGQLFRIYALYFLAAMGMMIALMILIGIVVAIVALILGDSLPLGPNQIGELNAKTAPVFMQFIPVIIVLIAMVPMAILNTMLVTHRLAQRLCQTLSISGQLDYDAIAQSSREAPRFGEGLADALDIGGI